jgi:hypothetical protein
MKYVQTLGSFAVLTLLCLSAVSQRANAQVLVSYSCTPSTCLRYATGTGYFSNSMSITGRFWDGDVYNVRTNTKNIYSQGCTQSTTLTAYADTTSSPSFGAGILAHVEGSQAGLTLIVSEKTQYMNGSDSTTTPFSGVTPCL